MSTTNTAAAASPVGIHEIAEQAQQTLADACFRLELLTEYRGYKISTLARQMLKDLGPVVNALDHIETASAPQDAHGASTSTAAPAPEESPTELPGPRLDARGIEEVIAGIKRLHPARQMAIALLVERMAIDELKSAGAAPQDGLPH